MKEIQPLELNHYDLVSFCLVVKTAVLDCQNPQREWSVSKSYNQTDAGNTVRGKKKTSFSNEPPLSLITFTSYSKCK